MALDIPGPEAPRTGASPSGDVSAGTAGGSGQGRKAVRATIGSVWMGTTLEYVDFALYGLAAGLVFGPVFFPDTAPALALVVSYATYAVGFLARPAGALFFGRLGDRRGRKTVLLVTIALMGLATSGIGLLPSYATAGYLGPGLLLLLRMAQGFAAGAELSGGAIMLAETAEPKRRGLVTSVIAIGSNGGVLVASGVWLAISAMPKDDLFAWGWRIPFLASILLAAATVIMRRKMPESPVFVEISEQSEQPEAKAVEIAEPAARGHRAFLALLGLRIAENGPSYLCSTFVVGYVATYLSVSPGVPSLAVFIGALLGMATAPFVGQLSDRFGRRVVYRVLCAFLVVYPFVGYALMSTKNPTVVFAVIVVGFVIASVCMFAAQAAYGVELFGSRSRYKRMALGKEVGSALSGGIAPLVAAALLGWSGHWWVIAAYFALMAAIGFVTTFFTPETAGRDLHDARDAM